MLSYQVLVTLSDDRNSSNDIYPSNVFKVPGQLRTAHTESNPVSVVLDFVEARIVSFLDWLVEHDLNPLGMAIPDAFEQSNSRSCY